MATRPIRINLIADLQAWDGEVDANFALIFNSPFPIHPEANTTDLNNNFNPTGYEECIVVVAGVVYISDGILWKPLFETAADIPDSTATTATQMATDFNSLLASLRTAGIMEV